MTAHVSFVDKTKLRDEYFFVLKLIRSQVALEMHLQIFLIWHKTICFPFRNACNMISTLKNFHDDATQK